MTHGHPIRRRHPSHQLAHSNCCIPTGAFYKLLLINHHLPYPHHLYSPTYPQPLERAATSTCPDPRKTPARRDKRPCSRSAIFRPISTIFRKIAYFMQNLPIFPYFPQNASFPETPIFRKIAYFMQNLRIFPYFLQNALRLLPIFQTSAISRLVQICLCSAKCVFLATAMFFTQVLFP